MSQHSSQQQLSKQQFVYIRASLGIHPELTKGQLKQIKEEQL